MTLLPQNAKLVQVILNSGPSSHRNNASVQADASKIRIPIFKIDLRVVWATRSTGKCSKMYLNSISIRKTSKPIRKPMCFSLHILILGRSLRPALWRVGRDPVVLLFDTDVSNIAIIIDKIKFLVTLPKLGFSTFSEPRERKYDDLEFISMLCKYVATYYFPKLRFLERLSWAVGDRLPGSSWDWEQTIWGAREPHDNCIPGRFPIPP